MALLAEIKNLVKKIKRVSDGQACIMEIGEDMTKIKIKIKPKDGLYKGGTFIFQITVDQYEFKTLAPHVVCLTSIYHPNIDTTELDEDESDIESNVCLNMLDEWRPSYGLDGLINGLLFFFYHPEIEDSLSPYIGPGLSAEEFAENVRKSMIGGEVDGVMFERNCDDESEIVSTADDKNNIKNDSLEINDSVNKVIEKMSNLEESINTKGELQTTKSVTESDKIVNKLIVPQMEENSFHELNCANFEDVYFSVTQDTKNLLSSGTSAKTVNFQSILERGKSSFCFNSMKSFDGSVPEANFIHLLLNQLLSHLFCCRSDSSAS